MLRVKDGFLIQKMMDGYIIVPTGKNADSFHAMIQTNETGAFYWHLLEKGTTPEELARAATERFVDLDETTALLDINEFLENISAAVETVE